LASRSPRGKRYELDTSGILVFRFGPLYVANFEGTDALPPRPGRGPGRHREHAGDKSESCDTLGRLLTFTSPIGLARSTAAEARPGRGEGNPSPFFHHSPVLAHGLGDDDPCTRADHHLFSPRPPPAVRSEEDPPSWSSSIKARRPIGRRPPAASMRLQLRLRCTAPASTVQKCGECRSVLLEDGGLALCVRVALWSIAPPLTEALLDLVQPQNATPATLLPPSCVCSLPFLDKGRWAGSNRVEGDKEPSHPASVQYLVSELTSPPRLVTTIIRYRSD
jgi:hypothetical protein